jgi:hypothetical protein
MGNNYDNYALLEDDDPLEQCILYFWDSLGDDIYPKHFLDSLLQMTADVESGKAKTIPIDRIKDLVDWESYDTVDDLIENLHEE